VPDQAREQMVVHAQLRGGANALPSAPATLPHDAGC
jgi:hypothetical protein